MLKLRYDIFGADAIGNAKLVGKYEFPHSPGVKLNEAPERIVPFDRMKSIRLGDWVHFYVHDKRFHRFLSRREHYWTRLKAANGFIGADNSMYRDLPLAEQIHSCYLNRAIDYFLNSKGCSVVANVSWGDWRSYEFCFDGVAKHSTIAISSYGCCRSRVDRSCFEDGFVMMVERLEPYSVILHGAVWDELMALVAYHKIPLLRIPTQRALASIGAEVSHG
ncbi:MAG: DUF4417 domain-containing protein [Kiritimatiellia bacterium]